MVLELITKADLQELKERLDRLDQRINDSKKKQETVGLYTNAGLCKLLQVSARTLQNWRDKGLISFSQVGSKIYYSCAALEQFLEQHKVKRFN